MHLLTLILVFLAVGIVSSISCILALKVANTASIQNEKSRRTVNAVITSLVRAVIWSVGFSFVGMPFTLLSFIAFWAILGVFDYIWPTTVRR